MNRIDGHREYKYIFKCGTQHQITYKKVKSNINFKQQYKDNHWSCGWKILFSSFNLNSFPTRDTKYFFPLSIGHLYICKKYLVHFQITVFSC